MPEVPSRLRVEHLGCTGPRVPLVPAAPGSPPPRLSWQLPPTASGQRAYRLRARIEPSLVPAGAGPDAVSEHDSGWLDGDESVLVPWPAPPVEPGRQVRWQVRVRTDRGETGWSATGAWETVDPGAGWTARWIEPADPQEGVEPGLRSATLMRGRFTLDDPHAATMPARLRLTAHGLVEAWCNGVRVGADELLPGFTAYRRRLQVHHLDVTGLLRPGANVLGLVLSDGWFRGRHGFLRQADGFGRRTAALAQLETASPAGPRTVLATDGAWTCTAAWFTADLMDGQREDRRLAAELAQWAGPGSTDAAAGDGGWQPVHVASGGLYEDVDRLTVSPAPPVRAIRRIEARSVTALAHGPRAGSHVVDLGENLNGRIRLTDLGPEGTELTLTHGESLDAEGAVTTEHLRSFDFRTGVPLPAGQVDVVVSAGVPGDVFEPRHTTHGFRYVQVDGHPGPLSAADVEGVVLHTALDQIGTFTCSDERLETLHEIAVRSFLSNACDIPTDCPQRERSGFSGDWQIFQPSALFTHDVAGFSTKWLRDLLADQWSDGTVTNISPDPDGPDPDGSSPVHATNGAAGWGDAIVLVPWQLWRATGDSRPLAEAYDGMRRWVDRGARAAAGSRHPARAAARPVPAPHERFLWDTGFHFGEWLEPGVEPRLDPAADHGIVATAYLHLSARRLADVAALLGRHEDAARYRAVADGARDAWQAEYLLPDGSLTEPTQAHHVRALAFGLVPPPMRAEVARRLAERVRDAGTRLGTGFLTTGLLLPTLADNGYGDLAHEVLMSTGVPSWLEMPARGATTVWERWDGVDEHGRAQLSLNHYSKGAVIEFLHGWVAGLRPLDEPDASSAGWRRFLVRPVPGPRLERAGAEHLTPYGRAAVEWMRDRDGRGLQIRVTVPPGTTARLDLPGAPSEDLGPGVHRRDAARP